MTEANNTYEAGIVPHCEKCDTPVKKKWAYRIADMTARNHRGPIYFCTEECREDWREDHVSEDTMSRGVMLDEEDQLDDDYEWGDYPES